MAQNGTSTLSRFGVLTDTLPLAIGRRLYPPILSRYNLVSESLHGRTSEANHAQGLMHFPKVNYALREYTRLYTTCSEERMATAKGLVSLPEDDGRALSYRLFGAATLG